MNDHIKEKQGSATQRPIEKISTRIPGLDAVLRGGLPKGRMTLLVGGPGTGKTNIALGISLSQRAGEPGILVAFEERADIVRANALSLGWDLAPLESAIPGFTGEREGWSPASPGRSGRPATRWIPVARSASCTRRRPRLPS